jgi:predicted DNA-binding transcriptional regulator YafY
MPAVAEKLYSRPPVERMLRIHEKINAGGYPNATTLAAQMEVNSRTIIRDLDFMKYRLNLPIEYDSRKYGFFYTSPVKKFPLLPVSEAEIFALAVAHKAIAQYRGTPFERPLQSAFRKLTGLVGGRDSYQIGDLESALSFRPFAPEDTDIETFEVLTRALRELRVLKFRYRNLGAERGQQRHVRPCHLACVDNIWYLFAFDTQRGAIRMFNLTRLAEPELLKEKFKPIAFDLDQHLQGGLNAYSGQDDYEVVLLFDRWGADLVRGRRWHRSQEMLELHGGRIRMRLRLNNLHEVERFVLGFGEHVIVERPQGLRDRLHQVCATVVGNYAADKKVLATSVSSARKTASRLL